MHLPKLTYFKLLTCQLSVTDPITVVTTLLSVGWVFLKHTALHPNGCINSSVIKSTTFSEVLKNFFPFDLMCTYLRYEMYNGDKNFWSVCRLVTK